MGSATQLREVALHMAARRTGPDRLSLFSDGVFAVIITILVLDLKPPDTATTTTS